MAARMTARSVVVIVGASLAGVSAAHTLRDAGFDGRVVMIGDEAVPPYERPPLSKEYLRGEAEGDALLARPDGWYEDQAVELLTDTQVARIEPATRSAVLADGAVLPFDTAILATGATERRLGVPGADLPGVFYLRTVADADAIRRAALQGGPAVVVGMGFVGAEVAASLRQMGIDVTVVEAYETVLWRALGPEAGRALERVHRDHGVRFHLGDGVSVFEGDGRVERVRTAGGAAIECAFAVVGIGVRPNTGPWPWRLAADGGIPVGPTLETEMPGVFAAGDVASHEHPRFGRLRVEHYDNAIVMGAAAARNVLGAQEVVDDPHWFWSEQYDLRVEMVGVRPDDPTVVLRGSYEEGSFCAFQLDRSGALWGAISVARPRDVRRAAPLVQAGVRPDPASLADPDVDLRTLVPAADEP